MLDVNQSQGCLVVCNLVIGEEICADENTEEEEGLCNVHVAGIFTISGILSANISAMDDLRCVKRKKSSIEPNSSVTICKVLSLS